MSFPSAFRGRISGRGLAPSLRRISTTKLQHGKEQYKLVIIGGGAAGATMSNKFGPRLGKGNVAVVEFKDKHYYQPAWTLVGAGLRTVEWTGKDMARTIDSKNCTWIKERAVKFIPDKNLLETESKEIEYDYLIISPGLELRYDLIKGLPEAFETPGVCSNYHKDYVQKTFPAIQNVKSGNAVFTFPNTPVKCAGAPQKICYMAEDIWRRAGVRDQINIYYNTSLPVIFGIKKYAAALTELVAARGITLNTRHNLVEVKPDSREAVFDILDENGKPKGQKTWKYEMLHVGAPCSPIEPLRKCPELTDAAGWVTVNKDTMQHTRYPNIFAMGDCTNAPTAKTAAAVSGQCGVVRQNLLALMKGKEPYSKYDGYTSCPLLTSNRACIMAEFDYSGEPLETFPFNQGMERWTMYHMKKNGMPIIYWQFLLRGYWEGPGWVRKLLHLGFSK